MLPDSATRSLVVPALAAIPLLALASPGRSQIIPDATLPANSAVTTDGTTFTIDGGTTAGANLFHSFDRFDLPTGTRALFNNAATVNNILTRVTGASVSEIDGTLAANGTANLFFINPNGITFGSNAALDIGGSFLASSASAIEFANGGLFSTLSTQVDPLLLVSVPTGLQLGSTPGAIVNRSIAPDNNSETVGLQVSPFRSLALIGGEIRLEGGFLRAPAGRVELGSVADSSRVGIDLAGNNLNFNYETVSNFQDVNLFGGATVDVSGDPSGSVNVRSRTLQLSERSHLLGINTGSQPGGTIALNATDLVELVGTGNYLQELVALADFGINSLSDDLPTGVYTSSLGSGAGGNITINTQQLVAREGAFVMPVTEGAGRGGNLAVNTSDSVELTASALRAFTVSEEASGNGGDITLNTRRLLQQQGGTVTALTDSMGRGGNLTVNASESIDLIGVPLLITRRADGGTFATNTGLIVSTAGSGGGEAGELQVSTQRLTVRNGAALLATSTGQGQPGNISIRATESVELIGQTPSGFTFPSSIQASLFEPRAINVDSGNVTIVTDRLVVRDGASVSVNNAAPGIGGGIDIVADSILLDGEANIQAETAFGLGGNVNIQARSLQLRDNSEINVTGSSGDAVLENIILSPERLEFIESLAAIEGDGGNIIIETDTLVALENSDINADSQSGLGGRVSITADGIFGTEFRAMETPESDITATSALGAEFSGVVEVQTPDVDPNEGLVELEAEPVDPAAQIAIGCNTASANTFVISQRGGLPEDPSVGLRGRAVWWDGRDLSRLGSRTPTEEIEANPVSTLTEARRWAVSPSGEVQLMAGSSDWYDAPECRDLATN